MQATGRNLVVRHPERLSNGLDLRGVTVSRNERVGVAPDGEDIELRHIQPVPFVHVPDPVGRRQDQRQRIEYLLARILLNDQSNQTLTLWLSYFLGTSRNTDWGALMAASTLTAIPVIVFFLLVQRRIAFGLTAGAVKG